MTEHMTNTKKPGYSAFTGNGYTALSSEAAIYRLSAGFLTYGPRTRLRPNADPRLLMQSTMAFRDRHAHFYALDQSQ